MNEGFRACDCQICFAFKILDQVVVCEKMFMYEVMTSHEGRHACHDFLAAKCGGIGSRNYAKIVRGIRPAETWCIHA
jgi:hypothetical protein